MHSPPKFFTRCFEWFCKPEHVEELQGDLEEAFYENVESRGLKKAKAIYRMEVIKMIRPSVIKNLNPIPSNIMQLPRNYFKTSLRAIKLNPFYVFANVFGLALALSICTIGYFNYRFNATFNDQFEQADKLYKVHGIRTGQSTLGISPASLAPALNASGITAMRYTTRSVSLRERDRLFQSRIAFVDPAFLKHIEFTSLEGSRIYPPEQNEIIISEKLALKLFDERYPIGQLVKLVLPNQEDQSFMVKDVFEEPPTNESFAQSAFLSMDNYYAFYQLEKGDWTNWVDGTFIYANSASTLQMALTTVEESKAIQNANNQELVIDNYQLDNLIEWPAFEDELYRGRFRNHLHPSSVAGIAGSAITILLLACFNFINTSIALSGKRLKEIAVRKILGGNQKSTISQFMIENTFMITLAVVVSFGISYLLVPSYNALFQRELIQLDRVPVADILQFSIVLIIIVTILSAAYPSLYVAKFSPLNIFRNKVTLAGKSRMMATLLTFQFALCFYNIFGFFLLVDNSYYQETLDRGYDVEKVVNVPLNRPEQFQILRDAFAQHPDILEIAGTNTLVGFTNEEEFLNYEGVDYSVDVLNVGENYPEALGIRLNKGSFFANDEAEVSGVLINEMLQAQLGVDPLNRSLTITGKKYNVLGIVDDFNMRTIVTQGNKINPTVIKVVPPEDYRYAVARVNGSTEEANRQIEHIWYQVFPQELYKGFPQNDVLVNVTELNVVMVSINLFLAVITILISVLGLYTLISLKVQRRSKEFGVRKVLGASKGVIVHLLGKDLYWMMGIAAIFGLIAANLVLTTVFDIIYAYHISPALDHFVKAIVVVLMIVLVTIGYKVYQTSRLNPVHQLRTE